jgi:hypothetical protein
MNKLGEATAVIDMWKPEIVGFVETWCNTDIQDSLLCMEGYSTPFRADKTSNITGRGGGALLYFHESLTVVPCKEFDSIPFETSLWCTVKLSDGDNLLVGLVYRSPNSTKLNNDSLLEIMQTVSRVRNISHVLIFGDFNYSDIDWETMSVTGGESSEPGKFYTVVEDMFLVQHVDFPTRFRMGQQPTRPDLVFTNEENMIEKLEPTSPLGLSDHVGLAWTYVTKSSIKRSFRDGTWLNFQRANPVEMEEKLTSFDWESDFEGKNVDECWKLFSERCEKVVQESVLRVKVKSPKPPWVRDGVQDAVKRKHSLWKRMSTPNSTVIT